MRVAVVGGGLAGLAAALELTKQGHDVRLVQYAPAVEDATLEGERLDLVGAQGHRGGAWWRAARHA